MGAFTEETQCAYIAIKKLFGTERWRYIFSFSKYPPNRSRHLRNSKVKYKIFFFFLAVVLEVVGLVVIIPLTNDSEQDNADNVSNDFFNFRRMLLTTVLDITT